AVHCELDRFSEDGGLLRWELDLEAEHSGGGRALADEAAVLLVDRVRSDDAIQGAAVAAADPPELRRGRRAGDLEQRRLVLRRRDAGQRADLRVADPAAAKRVVDPRQRAERPGDADLLACRADVEADPPR